MSPRASTARRASCSSFGAQDRAAALVEVLVGASHTKSTWHDSKQHVVRSMTIGEDQGAWLDGSAPQRHESDLAQRDPPEPRLLEEDSGDIRPGEEAPTAPASKHHPALPNDGLADQSSETVEPDEAAEEDAEHSEVRRSVVRHGDETNDHGAGDDLHHCDEAGNVVFGELEQCSECSRPTGRPRRGHSIRRPTAGRSTR
jgi:hypothetical protein